MPDFAQIVEQLKKASDVLTATDVTAVDVTAVDVTALPGKVQNQIKELRKIRQQIIDLQKQIKAMVGDMQNQVEALYKLSDRLESDLMPLLRELEDHSIKGEGILVELGKGRRSPKVGYEYLADRVTTTLKMAAEAAMIEAAKFAQTPKVQIIEVPQTVAASEVKTGGLFAWLKDRFSSFVKWLGSFKKRTDEIGDLIQQLDKATPKA